MSSVYQVFANPVPGTGIFTVTSSTSAGDAIVVVTNTGGATTGVTDTQGNTYVAASNDTGFGVSMWAATYNGTAGTPTVALTGGTDTITFTGSSQGGSGVVVGVTGVLPVAADSAPAYATGTSAAPSGPATGTLSQPGDIIVYGLAGGWTTSASGVTAWGGSLAQVGITPNGTYGIAVATELAAGTGPVTPSATLASSQQWVGLTLALTPAQPHALAGQGTASAGPAIRVTGSVAGQGAAAGAQTGGLAIVQAATPVFLASLTGPVNVTLSPTGSGNSLVVCASAAANASINPQVTGITLGGSADNWENCAVLNSATRTDAEIWYDPNCASGQTAVAVTFGGSNGSTGNLWVSVYEVTGVISTDRTDTNEATGTTFTSGTTPAVAKPGEIFFGVINATATSVTVTGAGTWTSETLGGGTLGSFHGSAYQTVSTGGTATFSGTLPGSDPYAAAVATFYTGTPQARWAAVVFQQIDNGSAGYTGVPQLTSALQSPAVDFPGGATPQTNQSLPCHFEPLTDYFQGGFPWPTVMGFMSPPWITGPAQTGLTNVIASLYLGSGIGAMTDFDSSGYPLNKKVVTHPASIASLPVPAGSWPGEPTMAGGGTAVPAIPIIAWHLESTPLTDIAAGVHDVDTIIPVAQQCAAWPADASGNPAYPGQPGGRVFIRLMHEFNITSSYYCPATLGETTANFVAAWQHIVQVFAAQGATNVRWIWCPNVASSGAGTTGPSPWNNTSGTAALMYPGDAYVDYIGMDGYNQYVPTWDTFATVFQTTYNWITKGDAYTGGPICNTKRFIICETNSFEDDAFTSPPQTKAQYIGAIAPTILASMPLIEGVTLWHSCINSLETIATSSTASAAAWDTLATTWTGRPAASQGVTAGLGAFGTSIVAGQGTATATATVRAPATAAGAGAAAALPSSFQPPITAVVAGSGAAQAAYRIVVQATVAGQGAAGSGLALRAPAAVHGAGVVTAQKAAAVDISAEPGATVYGRVAAVSGSQQDGKAAGGSQQDGKAVGGTAVTITVGNIVQDRGN